ncbi:MAG TPA: transporter substrate-binding domain-containing protein, partial [Bacteroidales bacterium]|nr:transporter substrate-binding domain-containing protein [Bacteroidales bacterium]
MFQSESFKIAANDQYNKLHKSISKFLPTPEVSAITRMVQTGKWWLIILFVITLFNSCREGKNEILTPEERNWLASQDNITFVHDKSFAPVDFIGNEGVQKGITSDIQKLIEERINYQFISVNKDSWSEMINSVKYRENDIIANIQNTEERQQFLKFTSPYISIPNVIIVNKNAEDELTLSDLSDKKVAIVEDYATINFSKTINPNIQIVEVKDNIKGLQMIAFNQVDALIVDIAIASYYIETLGISNLKIAGNINYDWNLCIATNKDAEMLHSILQKGLDAISQDEIKAIYSKWIHLEITPFYKTKEFWFTILSLILISVIIIITILLWNKTLKQKVKQKTRELIKAKEKAEESDKLKTEFIRNM